MENLLVSFNVVAPLFLLLAVGVLLQRLGMISPQTENQMNNLVFRCFLPLLLFHNITTAQTGNLNPRLLLFSAASVLVMFGLSFCITLPLEKENARRGVLIQSMFRSNFVLFGLPVTVSLFGQEAAGTASLMIAVVVPLFNMLAVTDLEIFRGGAIRPGKILRGIFTNPLILASLLGLAFLFLGLRLPAFLESAVSDLAGVATPLAFVVLGASFRFSDMRNYPRQLFLGLSVRLVIFPALFLPIAADLGFRGPEMAAALAMLASPTAVSSFTMARQMGGDSSLAGQLVIFGTLLSLFTMFLWVFGLKQVGLL